MLLRAMADQQYVSFLLLNIKSNLEHDDGIKYDNRNPVALPLVLAVAGIL